MATWTEAQQRVIDTRNKNILVSAAAGSGKTAVLVERIIKRIMDKDNPIDVDKIMVVTFTNAAAGEMRERILKAIEQELEKDPDNLHLRKQQAYIHNAYITTIHSFCLNLVKEHFNDIDLDPGVRVGDPGEMELLKSDVVKEVIEEYYSSESKEFHQFVEQFENRTSDDYIEEMILSLYGKAMGYPWPKKWLEDCVKKYEYTDENDLKNSEYVEILNQYADGVLLEMLKQYDIMLDLCNNGGPFVYLDILTKEKEQIEQIYAQKDYDKRKVKLNMEFSRLPACKKDSCDSDLKDMVTESRNNVKDGIAKLKKRIYSQSIGEAFTELHKCRDIIETYVDITKTFMDKFQEKKKTKNLIDFDDFEHYAIEILVSEENGKFVPTKTADEIAKDFEEIMVDEYQDSNMVQETLLNALSKERFGINNRFMVGDVKQSIYGFRGANPDIFVEKYNTYKTSDSEPDYKIILDRNFRSRRGVIDTTNFLFYQIMNSELGNIDYDDENKLYFGAVLPEPDDNFAGRIDDRAELILINTKEKTKDIESDFKENSKEYDITEDEADDENMEATAFEVEGKVIAGRIKELTDKEKGMVVFDKELQKYRPLQYSDIVILLRSIGKNADGISSELMKEGIPVYMESKEGYFKTIEIRNVISYLKIIDNPTLDIPMAAVLKSPFAEISDEEIAVIRAVGGKDVSLFEDMKLYIELGESEDRDGNITNPTIGIKLEKSNEIGSIDYKKDETNTAEVYLPVGIEYDRKLAQKLKSFLEQLTFFRDKVMYMSIYDLVSEVIEKTGYYDFVCAMPSGSQRVANIEMLKAKAAAYENGSYKGLFNFIRYIEKMNKYNIDLGEASIASDSDNTVRIMTIHKSKGLEFPVVFLSNINKQFNLMDAKKKAVVHSKLGIGMDYMDEDTRVSKKNLMKFAINKKIELEAIEEELRLFYVACTRAKDKLIFTGGAADEKRILKMTAQRNNHSSYLGYGVVSQFNSYMDFITIPLARNKAFCDIYQNVIGIESPVDNPIYGEESNLKVRYVKISDVAGSLVKEKYLEAVSTEVLKNLDTEMVYSENVKKMFGEIMSFEYLYRKQIQSHAKMSVSEIKKISYESEQDERLAEDVIRFDFMAEYTEYIQKEQERVENPKSTISGAGRGTIYHMIFEKFDYDMEPSWNNIAGMIERFEKEGVISTEEKECIWIKHYFEFTKSELYRRMKAAYLRGELKREQQFVVGFSESEIDEFKRVAKIIGETGKIVKPEKVKKTGDTILIQGIIDAFFIEDGKIILVDYKTDNVKNESELIQYYYIQLELYKKAVEQITGMTVSQKILYSTKLGKDIVMA